MTGWSEAHTWRRGWRIACSHARVAKPVRVRTQTRPHLHWPMALQRSCLLPRDWLRALVAAWWSHRRAVDDQLCQVLHGCLLYVPLNAQTPLELCLWLLILRRLLHPLPWPSLTRSWQNRFSWNPWRSWTRARNLVREWNFNEAY